MPNGGGLTYESAKHLAIKAVIESQEGHAAMAKAVASGQPAACGVDALLTGIIVGYDDHDCLQYAGRIVAERMRALDHVEGAVQNCPPGCTMKQGTTWLPAGS